MPQQTSKTNSRLKDYLSLSKSVLSKPLKNVECALGVTMAIGVLGALQSVDAAVVYSGVQNVSCNLVGATNRCYANIDLAGGNDFEFHRNHVAAQVFIQVDEVIGGGFSLNGFNGQVAGGYVYPYALNTGAPIGPAGPWGFQAGQANSMSDNGFYPNHKWESLPNGTTRFMGFRGVKAGQTNYGWMRLTKNSFGNYTIVDWAYNNVANAPINAGQTFIPTAADASISGRVVTFDGRAIPNAVLTFTDSTGRVLTARSSPFGYFKVQGIESGGTVTVTITSKGYEFAPSVLTIGSSIEDAVFMPISEN